MLIHCSSPPLQQCESTAIFVPNLKSRSKSQCPISCNFSIISSYEASLFGLSRKPTKKFRVPKLSLPVLGKEARSSPLTLKKVEEVSWKLWVGEEDRKVRPFFFVSTVSGSSVSWLALVQVAQASEDVRANAVYEVGELFELGIQLSYLLLLLALLGAGTFFVIRQVLVRRELDLSAKELQVNSFV